jgi:hypothetical protein
MALEKLLKGYVRLLETYVIALANFRKIAGISKLFPNNVLHYKRSLIKY